MNLVLVESVGEGIQIRSSSKRISNSSSLVSSKKFCLLDTNLVKGVQVGLKKKQKAKPNQILINNANKLPLDKDFLNFLNLVLIKQLNKGFNAKLSI